MTIRTADDLYYDPWDVDLNADPLSDVPAHPRERPAVLQHRT